MVVEKPGAEQGADGGSRILGHAEQGVCRVDKGVHAPEQFVGRLKDGFDILGLACGEEIAFLQDASLAAADVDVDDAGRNQVLVADGEDFGAVGNPVLEFLADGEFHKHAVILDFHLRNLADIHAADLDACARTETQGLFERTVELVLLDADHSASKKLGIENQGKKQNCDGKKDADQQARHFHPVDLVD